MTKLNIGVGIAGVVVGLLLGSVVFSGGSLFGGIYNTVTPQNDSGTKSGDAIEKTISKAFPVAGNSVMLYHNTSGRDVLVDFGSITIPTGETASTTYQMSVFATTSSAIPASQDYTALAEARRLLIGTSVATSSTATSTNSVYAAKANNGNGAILVPNNSYVFGYLQNLASGGGGKGCSGSVCETATSTNRGTNPIVNIHLLTLTSSATTL